MDFRFYITRNRLKRQLREIVRSQIPNLKNFQNFVVVAHPTLVECDFHKIEKELLSVLKKGNLLNEQILDGS